MQNNRIKCRREKYVVRNEIVEGNMRSFGTGGNGEKICKKYLCRYGGWCVVVVAKPSHLKVFVLCSQQRGHVGRCSGIIMTEAERVKAHMLQYKEK